MHHITLRLLQTPLILLDGAPIILPFKKAEALIYYLAVKKNISREHAATLLWDTNDEQVARKNLRHTLYTIKKVFQLDLIVSLQRQFLSFNPDVSFDIDYDHFIESNALDLYQGDLLLGFSIKNTEVFEEWLAAERSALKDTYLRMLHHTMLQAEANNLPLIETCYSKYIKEDPLDERIYLAMMEAYQKNQLYHKGIKVYQNLSKLLNAELRIAPSQNLVILHRELLNAWTESTSAESHLEPLHIIGRAKEMQYLTNVYHSFLSGTPIALSLVGENGVGKTYLMNQFLDHIVDDSCIILRAICFHAEKDFAFQPWNAIMLQLDYYMQNKQIQVPESYLTNISNLFPLFASSNLTSYLPEDAITSYNYRATRNSILKLFTLIGEDTPIILAFDNIQFMDSLSIELLSLIVRDKNPNIMVIGTCLDMLPPRMQHHIKVLLKEKLMSQLVIHPFTKDDVAELVLHQLGEHVITPSLLETIYQETEGNAFFLDMVLTYFSSGDTGKTLLSLHPQDLLSDRIAELSTDSRQVLETISICHNYSTLNIMESILNRDTLEIIDLIDDLKQHGLIDEKVVDNQIRFQFRHNKMQDFVHSQLSPSKRRLLHDRVAAYLEQALILHDNTWYQNLIYHYTLSGNAPKVLQYKILSLEDYSRYNYELYPILHPHKDSELEAPKRLIQYFDELSAELMHLYHYQPNALDFEELEAHLTLVIGKYYISTGTYDKGVFAISQTLQNNSHVLTHPQIRISYLRQLTFYGIQVWDTHLMHETIQKSMAIATEHHLNTEYAIECRLYGLYLCMCGKYDESKEYLNNAIQLFQSTTLEGQSYGLNIAACYNYLGEAERKQCHFDASIEYYDRAITICDQRNCPQNPTFYSNKARSLFALSKYPEAITVLITANRFYDDSSVLVGRSITKGYYSIVKAHQGQMKEAAALLASSIHSAITLDSPMALGLLAATKALLLHDFPDSFKDLIEEDSSTCCLQAIDYLEKAPGSYELETIKNLALQIQVEQERKPL